MKVDREAKSIIPLLTHPPMGGLLSRPRTNRIDQEMKLVLIISYAKWWEDWSWAGCSNVGLAGWVVRRKYRERAGEGWCGCVCVCVWSLPGLWGGIICYFSYSRAAIWEQSMAPLCVGGSDPDILQVKPNRLWLVVTLKKKEFLIYKAVWGIITAVLQIYIYILYNLGSREFVCVLCGETAVFCAFTCWQFLHQSLFQVSLWGRKQIAWVSSCWGQFWVHYCMTALVP